MGRRARPLHFSEIDALDAELPTVGNRFDVVGGGVLYAATEKVGAYKETIAAMRPAASSAKYASAVHMTLGNLPAEWRSERLLASFELTETLPFLDIEQDQTLTFLTQQIPAILDRLGIKNLDSSHVRGSNRILTRAIAKWAYTAVDDDDETRYSGIRFSSRFQSHESWAIFEGVTFGRTTFDSIDKNDPHLRSAAREFGIVVH